MIEKEYGHYFGICDVCGEVTPLFDTFQDCHEHIKENRWKTTKNKATGEWENICPRCRILDEF